MVRKEQVTNEKCRKTKNFRKKNKINVRKIREVLA